MSQRDSVECQVEGLRERYEYEPISFNTGTELSLTLAGETGPRGVSPISADLVDFAAAVYQIERQLRRKNTSPPERYALRMKLRQPQAWNEEAIAAARDVLYLLGDAVWDTSAVLTDHSVVGKALHTLIGYVARPDGIQILFYLATLFGVWLLTKWVGSPPARRPGVSLRRGIETPLVILLLLGGLGAGSVAEAQLKVRYPIVDYREVEIEHFGDITFDKPNSGKTNNQRYTNEYGLGPLPGWFVELGTEFQAPNGQNITYDATEIENYVQLTPTGKYWGDLAMFAEYEMPIHRGDAKSFLFGPLGQAQFGAIAGFGALHTLNLLFTKTVGNNSTDATRLNVAWQSRLLIDPGIAPGFEYYSQIDQVLNPGKPADQQHRIGPVLVGLQNFAPYGKLKYEAGYQFGLTSATPRGAARWRLEYEIAF